LGTRHWFSNPWCGVSLLTNIAINPVVAWQVWPNLSIGAGLAVNYAAVNVRSGLVWPTQHNDQFRFKGDGWDVGYNLGVLWRPHEKISLGVSFRSSTTYDLEGHTEYFNHLAFPPGAPVIPAFPKQHVTAEAHVPFPLNAVFGISYRPTPKWNLEFNADYTDWSTLDTVTIKQNPWIRLFIAKEHPGSFELATCLVLQSRRDAILRQRLASQRRLYLQRECNA
jgi:long-chain fatty acid transport protein